MGSSVSLSSATPHHHVQAHCCPCLAFVVAVASAEPRYAKLQNKLACSLDQVIMCEGEIENAWNQCWDAASIQDCINGVLAASDCKQCVCDVLEWLGLMTC